MRAMRVIVTRPETEARRWGRHLRERGFDALELPLIAILPAPQPAALESAWPRLAAMRAVMFVSGAAVGHFFAQRPAQAPWPQGTRAWATGTGTRQALLDVGLEAASIDAPSAGATQFDSEALWQVVAGQVRPGERVLIVRGAEQGRDGTGRDWLAERLLASGVQVQGLVAYVRAAPQFSPEQMTQARRGADAACVWLFSSSQAIAHLQALLPGQDWSRARAVATHPRIAQTAREAGFGVVCESRPTEEAVTAALESFR
jgi:uroporphyrinogen-III synthase